MACCVLMAALLGSLAIVQSLLAWKRGRGAPQDWRLKN